MKTDSSTPTDSDTSRNLAAALEASYFFVPDLPGRLERLEISDMRGWRTTLSHRTSNVVGWTDGARSDPRESVRRVRDMFDRRCASFTWLVGPAGRRAGVVDCLRADGLTKTDEFAAMAIHGLEIGGSDPSDVVVREVEDASDPSPADALARAFEVPLEVGQLYHDAYTLVPAHHRTRVFLAALRGQPGPAAIGYLSYLPQYGAVLLRAAGTLQTYRRHGLYCSLVRRRLQAAREDGFEVAFVHAGRASARVCAALGFEARFGVDVYSWQPEGRHRGATDGRKKTDGA